jgi:hypothetical protein
MNRPCSALVACQLLALSVAFGATVLTADPLTKIALYPATVGVFGTNPPTRLPDSRYCGSKMQADMYTTLNSDIVATNAWYASHLQDFKHGHAYSGGRSRDIYYSANGTRLVSVDGDPGADGAKVDTHIIIYMLFQPGVTEKTILGTLQGKTVC